MKRAWPTGGGAVAPKTNKAYLSKYKLYLICITTSFDLTQVLLRFTFGLQNIVRRKYTSCGSIKAQSQLLNIIKNCKVRNVKQSHMCIIGSAGTDTNTWMFF
jgi:hypothetical protein